MFLRSLVASFSSVSVQLGEWRCGSTRSWPRHWMRVDNRIHAPDALLLGCPWCPLGAGLGRPRGRSGRGGGNGVPGPRRESRAEIAQSV
jgi:hypothetical protein